VICASLLAIMTSKKISPHATHTAAEKLLARSTTTPSNIQATTNVQRFSAASGATRADAQF